MSLLEIDIHTQRHLYRNYDIAPLRCHRRGINIHIEKNSKSKSAAVDYRVIKKFPTVDHELLRLDNKFPVFYSLSESEKLGFILLVVSRFRFFGG
uniref:Uncharacterized protein n=1 Tax=Rhizophagus irregularis (strain DAOM 181602 / DAOM 197198 / MUCL 43194) TaxID=747089 RepID=U9TI07_RHIID